MTQRWTTRNELSFIDGLGTHTLRPVLNTTGRLALLLGYAEGISQRITWDEIDPQAVANHVRFKITALKAERSKEKH